MKLKNFVINNQYNYNEIKNIEDKNIIIEEFGYKYIGQHLIIVQSNDTNYSVSFILIIKHKYGIGKNNYNYYYKCIYSDIY